MLNNHPQTHRSRAFFVLSFFLIIFIQKVSSFMASMSGIKIARNNLRLQSSFLLSNQRRAFARSPASALSSRSIVSPLQGLHNSFRYGTSTAMFAEMSTSTNTLQNKVESARSNSPPADSSKSSVSSNPDTDNAVTKRAYYAGDELLRSKVTIVRTVDEAKVAIEALYKVHGAVHACDTEVMEIDLKEVGPVGNGKVTCLSIYSGPTVIA
jgi:hypothetical protein